MKIAMTLFFAIAMIGVFALISMSSQTPSAFAVQPTKQVLGYCPVAVNGVLNAGKPCIVGARYGVCACQTTNSYYPKYWQRDNCNCVIPSYASPPMLTT